MYKFCVVFALVVVAVLADDEPFSIGLGVLSPSYTQTVGKENVKVNFEQKDNGFSYSVGDPSTGTNTYLNFGPSAAGHSFNPAGYAGVNPAAGNPSPYAGASGYAAPLPNSAYSNYQAPSYGLGDISYGSQSSFGGSSALSGSYNGQPASPNAYEGESARKPEEGPSQILPAGFSYHATEGQSFLRQDSPDFFISDEPKDSSRGLAEQSFQDNKAREPQSSGKFLVNGLVGYGAGGQRGGLPVGGYAGPQFAGLVRENAEGSE